MDSSDGSLKKQLVTEYLITLGKYTQIKHIYQEVINDFLCTVSPLFVIF
jgi:hypothetical protein